MKRLVLFVRNECERRNRAMATGPIGAFAVLGLAVGLAILSPGAGFAQTIDQNLWATDGLVNSIVRDGETIYIGGAFGHVGPATGGGVPIDAASGGFPPSFPKVIGSVDAVAPDGFGGWYIGGSFTSVGGVHQSNLAHIAADLSLSAWNPSPNNAVTALAVSGSTVYVGGTFTSVGGQPRNLIAALDATTGTATAWNPNPSGVDSDCPRYCSSIYAMVVSGSTVYTCGDFTNIGGQARNFMAALDATTGAATAWDPSPNYNTVERVPSSSPLVSALAVSGSLVYAGGYFTNIGGQPRNRIAALDATTGAVTAWDPNANGAVAVLAVSGSTVYAAASFISGFTSIGGQPRNEIAAIDATTGAVTAWNPHPDAPFGFARVEALTVSGSTVYAGGSFASIGGQTRNNLAAIDATTGDATAWDPRADRDVLALAVSGSTVYAGGDFTSIGGLPRNNLAALDATTGAATAWNPSGAGDSTIGNPRGGYSVMTLAVSGSTVYAGGDFISLGGQPRNRVAALDATTGAATAWDPNADGGVGALAVSGSTVYVGASQSFGFKNIGGQPRNGIAAIDATTGAVTAWNPHPDNLLAVNALVADGSTVYAGGYFTSMGGQTRNNLAALDATTGAATAWNPDADGSVAALAVSGSTVYAGGYFSNIGGQTRYNLAALDATTGAATTWNPDVNGSDISALAVNGSTVYAGGVFGYIGGQPRSGIAALDATTGAATDWNPILDVTHPCGDGPCREPSISTIAVSGATVYVSGGFASIGGLPQTNFAAMSDATTPTLLALVSADAEPSRVRLTWFAGDGQVLTATVYRRSEKDGWSILGRVSADGTGRLVFEDLHATAGSRYGYRLGVLHGAAEEFLGETWVDVPRALEFALAGLRPNPASRELAVEFSLPDAVPARLELLDLAGRRMIVRDVGVLGGGSHVVSLAKERTISPGFYVLRLLRAGKALTAHAIVVR